MSERLKDHLNFFKPVYLVCVLLVAATVALTMATYAYEDYACGERWEKSNMKSQYRIPTGCLVEFQGAWIPEDSFFVSPEEAPL